MKLRSLLLRTPPWLVFALAKDHGRPIPLRVLASRSGLSLFHVERLAAMRNWDAVPVAMMLRYLEACGVEPCRLRRVNDYLKKTLKTKKPFSHLHPLQRARVLRLAAAA